LTAVRFDHTRVRGASAIVTDAAHSSGVGQAIAQDLAAADLVHVFVISNGLLVNGSDLVRGILEHLPGEVTVTGGLSGDGARFEKTWVMFDGEPQADLVAAIGFYGDRLRVGYGSLGGWDPFGPQRLITRSEGSVLFELDGQPALDLYKRYLGSHAAELPASGLLFPLAVTGSHDREPVVRTILSVDETAGSMTFAGDVPEGAVARLMKANFDRLIDGAAGAARTCAAALAGSNPDLAILISCVGRKLVLKQRVEEEVEAVRDVLGEAVMLTGSIVDVKAGYDRDLYMSADLLIGRRLQDAPIRAQEQDTEQVLLEVLARNEPRTLQYQLDIRGDLKSYEARLMPFLDAQILIVVRDITDRERALAELTEAKRMLEVRVAERTVELRETNQALRAGIREREAREPRRARRKNRARFQQPPHGDSRERLVGARSASGGVADPAILDGDRGGDPTGGRANQSDARLRRVIRATLESNGYRALVAEDGRDGLSVFQHHKEDIVCVVMDLTMPVMDGRQALERIRETAPSVPVVIISGYSREDAQGSLRTTA